MLGHGGCRRVGEPALAASRRRAADPRRDHVLAIPRRDHVLAIRLIVDEPAADVSCVTRGDHRNRTRALATSCRAARSSAWPQLRRRRPHRVRRRRRRRRASLRSPDRRFGRERTACHVHLSSVRGGASSSSVRSRQRRCVGASVGTPASTESRELSAQLNPTSLGPRSQKSCQKNRELGPLSLRENRLKKTCSGDRGTKLLSRIFARSRTPKCAKLGPGASLVHVRSPPPPVGGGCAHRPPGRELRGCCALIFVLRCPWMERV